MEGSEGAQSPGGAVLRCKDTEKKLESSIFNCISLGQWESARASFACLSHQPASRENARELLKILVLESANFWSESAAIPSPHHLSWLALDTYKSLFPNTEDKLPGYIQHLVEFRLLLYATRGLTSFSAYMASWLCRYHAVHVLKVPGATPEAVPQFPALLSPFLHDIIGVVTPILGHTIIRNLTVNGNSNYLSNNEALQSIYIDCLTGSLESLSHLKAPESLETDSSYDSQYESDHSSSVQSIYSECQRLVTLVCDILSLMDPLAEMVKLTKRVDRLFLLLLEAKYNVSSEYTVTFDSGRIYSCLLGRSTPFLINRFHEVEEYLRMTQAAESGGALASHLRQGTVAGDPLEEWRDLFYEALYDHRHLLESVLEAGLHMVHTGQLEELNHLVSRPEYAPLRPVLLLLGWDRYRAVGSGKDLLDTLWPTEISAKQPLLFGGCCRLAFQVELVQWCLEKARPHLQASVHTSIYRAGDMFKGLETHSVLYVLHHYTPLASLNPLEVVDILKHRPRVPSLAGPALSPPPQFSRSTTPIKTLVDSPVSLSLPAYKQGAVRPEQGRDISIFHSFCAMKQVLDAIWTAIQLANGIIPAATAPADEPLEPEVQPHRTKTSSKVARKLELGSSTTEPSTVSEEALEDKQGAAKFYLADQLYRQQVLDKLQEAKVYLSLTYPLNYRLEILENVFSLLFLTSEDIKQMKLKEVEGSSVQGISRRSPADNSGSSGTKGSISRSDNDVSTTISSIALIKSKHGFLMNEKIASDLLDMLQDCIFELRAARYVLSQATESSDESSLPSSAVKAAVSPPSLPQRSTKLEQYINEARWRLQLVSSKEGIMADTSMRASGWGSSGESGQELSESESEKEEDEKKDEKRPPKRSSSVRDQQKSDMVPIQMPKESQPQQRTPPFGSGPPGVMTKVTLSEKISPAIHTPSPSPTISRSSTLPLGFSGPPRLSPMLKRNSSMKQKPPEPVQAQHPEEEDSGERADDEERSPDQSKRRKRLKSRNLQAALVKKRRRKYSERMETGFSKSSTICQMLASSGSLLRMCLKHSNYLRASEVLKMFGMEGQFGEAFVHFSEQYEVVSQELSRKVRSPTPKQSPSSLTPSSELQSPVTASISSSSSARLLSSSLGAQGNLQVAILNATNSLVALESLHKLLAPASINSMLFSGDEHLEKAAQESQMLQMLVDHVPALVMLDIVCSSKVDGQIAKRIVELAASRCQPSLEALHTHRDLGHKKSLSEKRWSQDVALSGPFPLLLTLSDISGYFTQLTQPTLGLPPPPHTSPHSLLTTFTHHFKVSSIMNVKMFMDSYQEARERLTGILNQKGGTMGDIMIEMTQSGEQEDTGSLSREKHFSGSIFDELVRALKSNPHYPTLPSSVKERSLMKQPSTTSLGLPLDEGAGVRFFWQFSRYLSKLVELLVKCLGAGGSALPESSLLLLVLQESPTHMLGRLIFEKNIKPQRLEKLMDDFPLKIVDVLVKCCCPHIPSSLEITDTAPSRLPVPPVIPLNEGEVSDPIPDPCSFAQKLLMKLMATLRDALQHSQDAILGPEELLGAYNSPEMKKLLQKTPLLAKVDLRSLDTSAKQMSFYSNITNFLYVHAIILYLASEEEGDGGQLSMLSSSGLTLATMQSIRVIRTAYFSKVGYYIGQLGLISCYDLHYSILRKGLSLPLLSRELSLKTRLAPVKADPWSVFAPSSPDPRLLYVVHDGRVSSPLPTVLAPEDLTSSLRAAESLNLTTHVTIDLTKKEVTVPQWLFNHREDFVKPIWSDKTDPSYGFLSDLALLKYIHSKLPKEQAELLSPFLEAGEATKGKKPIFKVSVKKENHTFGYKFSAKRGSRSPKGLSKGRKITSGREERGMTQKALERKVDIRYTFTPETLSFVKQQLPLLAALANLLCPPPTGKSDPVDEEGEEGLGREEGEATGGKKVPQLLQSMRVKQKRPPPLQKRLSFDEKTMLGLQSSQPWRRQFEEVLLHFSDAFPMRQYLCARLGCFDTILPWDTSKSSNKGAKKSSVEHLLNLRRIAVLPQQSEELGDACSYAMRKLLERGKLDEAVLFLTSEPAASHYSKVQLLADIALSSVFVNQHLEIHVLEQSRKEPRDTINPLALLTQLSDSELAARLTLSSLHTWPVEMCVDMLSYCVHHLPSGSTLLPLVSRKLERMRVYAQVMLTCENPLPQVTGREWRATQSPWKNWSELASDSESRPDYVLRILLESKTFELARQWAAGHSLGQDVAQQIEVDYLFVLLEGDSPDPAAAQQVLDGLLNETLALQVCESVLEQCSNQQTTIFTLHYLLTRLAHCVHAARMKDYCNKLLGAKALLCLPTNVRESYESLVSEPILLVEQLLLDMKIDWAGDVIRKLRSDEHISHILTSDTPTLDHIPIIISEEDTKDPFTTLLMYYTAKALDFPQPVLISQAHPVVPTPTTATSTHPPSPGLPPTTIRHVTPARPIPMEEPPLSPSDLFPATTPQSSFIFTTMRRRASTTLMSPPYLGRGSKDSSFDLPSAPPPRNRWEPNADAVRCRVCRQVYFGMFSRRHHCRRCGKVVCAGCSSRVARMEGYDRPVRVCDNCFHHCVAHSSISEDSDASATDPNPNLGSVYPALALSPLHRWRLLSRDPLYNQTTRRGFYYEHTPNTALCLALVDLMDNLHVSAAYLLDCCHSVSAQLVPDSQGRVNEEVDHHFVIGLIQNLLLNAKLRFAEAGDSPGVELCDTYLSRVDLLRLLVSSRWSKIPSIQELTKPDLARRVRDRLIEDDRFHLAMEVSTKCQLDTNAVWAAWGTVCLKCGDYSKARNKFKHCLQANPSLKMVSNSQNTPLLGRIVELIEQNPLSVTCRQTQLSDDWSSVIVGSMVLSEKRTEDCDLDIHRFNECTYYIRTYGGPATLVTFFVRHNCWIDACKFILDDNCPPEIFVDHLWVPALKAGVIDHAQECLKSLDTSLARWEPYLMAACRYFSQRSLYSILYHTQLFMKDYIRAGMTCIKFFVGFSGRATTIIDLFSRLHYLERGRRHFHASLDAKRRPTDRRSGRSKGHRHIDDPQRGAGSGTKSMSTSELENHISTITMQIKVTDFLYQCADAMGTLHEPLPMTVGTDSSGRHGPQQPATLFSNGHVRAEVAIQLLTLCQDVIEGSELAKEVIQTYKLPPNSIFCNASRVLAVKQRYNDIRLLQQSVQKSHFASDTLNDDIIMAAIKVLANQTGESKQVDKLVQLLASEQSKIKALVQCGKLKNAYLVAIRSKLVNEVQNISEIAEKAGQVAIRDICEKWLQTNAPPR